MNTVKNCFLLLIGLISPLSPDTDKDVRLTDDNESDDDDDLDQLKTVVENKTDNKRQLIRKPLVQQPLLDGIPEVPFSLKNRKKNNKYQNFQEATIVEEPSLNESPHQLDHDIDSNSQGSDLRSTPRNLSTEDLSSERDDEILSPSSEKKSDEWSAAEATPSSSSTNNTNTTKFNYPSPQPNRSSTSDASSKRGSSAIESTTDVLNAGEDVTANGRETHQQTTAIPTINTPDAVASPPLVAGDDVKPAETKIKTPKTVSTVKSIMCYMF